MKYKKIMLILITAIFLASIAGVCAADANDTIVANENTNQIELSDSDKVIKDNLQTSEENDELTLTDNDVLGADSATYSDLDSEIRASGNVTLTHKNYIYDEGATAITISEANKVIDGNGAVIDMTGSTIRAFTVSASRVTIKNLTIKNANYDGDGGAIYFSGSGTVTNCNFENNFASHNGGAIYFDNELSTSNGGAIYLSISKITNCNFENNIASGSGGAIFCNSLFNATVDSCIFKTSSDTTVSKDILPPVLNVNNLTTFNNSGEKLTFDLRTNNNQTACNGNISIRVYYKNNNSLAGNYSCLSNEGWNVDLPSGLYYAIFDTEYAEFKPIIRTIKITDGTTFWDLNHTINANMSSVVTLTNDFYFNSDYDADFVNGININRQVTINGNGFTIDGNGKAHIFHVTSNDAVLENIIFINGYSTSGGGAVDFLSNGAVTNCNFTDNSATVNGGAVFFYDEGDVTNCNFVDNKAAGAAGDYSYGGAVYFSSTGTVTNCNFADNTATYGGAIRFSGSGTVSNCNFTNNTGGAISMYSGTVTNCNFTNNTASGDGGAIRFSGSGNVSNCNFVDNKATGDFSYGGAIYIYSGTVTNCNFTDNTADYGGAIRFSGSGTVSNCNFTDNSANYGGAVYFYRGTGSVSNCNFADNTATDGGAVNFLDTGNVTNCNFTNNHVNGSGGAVYFNKWGNVVNSAFCNNSASYGGAIYASIVRGTYLNVRFCNFTNNHVTNDGGAICTNYGNYLIKDSNFINNSAMNGGAFININKISFSSSSSQISIMNCTFIRNNASKEGGAVNRANCIDSNFIDNVAIGGSAISNIDYSYEVFNVEKCNFIRNHALGEEYAINEGCTVCTRGSVINSNFTQNTGGGLWGSAVNCNFNDNRGGALIGKVIIGGNAKNCTFINNDYGLLADGESGGHAENCIFINNNHAMTGYYAERCTFISNKEGALYIYSMLLDYYECSAVNCTFENNGGSAISIDETHSSDSKNMFSAINCNFTKNHGESGGAISGQSNCVNCNFISNSASSWGGAISGQSNCVNCNFISNSADYGGAMCGGVAENCNFINNHASSGGGAISKLRYVKTGITNCNLTNNVAPEGSAAYYCDFIKNCDFVNNTISSELEVSSTGETKNKEFYLIFRLKNTHGGIIPNAKVTVKLNGKTKTYITNSNGQFKMFPEDYQLIPLKKYVFTVTYKGNSLYDRFSSKSSVMILKATPKLTAKKATFKAKTKTKKYTVTLKTNKNKVMKNVKLYLKVNKKTYTAKTNSKGKATFKIKNLKKKGTFKATVTYKGNKYYNKVTKKINIKIK